MSTSARSTYLAYCLGAAALGSAVFVIRALSPDRPWATHWSGTATPDQHLPSTWAAIVSGGIPLAAAAVLTLWYGVSSHRSAPASTTDSDGGLHQALPLIPWIVACLGLVVAVAGATGTQHIGPGLWILASICAVGAGPAIAAVTAITGRRSRGEARFTANCLSLILPTVAVGSFCLAAAGSFVSFFLGASLWAVGVVSTAGVTGEASRSSGKQP